MTGRRRAAIAAAWVVFAAAAYFLQIRHAPPRGSELYYAGLRHSTRLFCVFAADRLLPLLAVTGIACVSALLGRRILRVMRVEGRGSFHRALLSFAVGLGCIGAIAGVLLLLGILRVEAIVLVATAAVALEHRSLRTAWARVKAWRPCVPALRGEIAAAGVLVIAAGWGVALAALPPTFADAVAHSFYIARHFLEQGDMSRLWWVPYSDGPVYHDLLFATAMLCGGAIAAKLLNAAAGLWVIGYTCYLARDRLAPNRPMLSAAIAFATPLGFYLTTNGFTDFFLTMYCLVAIDAFLNWRDEHCMGWAAVAGVGLGLGLGIKPTAVLVFGLLVVAIAAAREKPARARVRAVASMAAVALALAMPWYLRSYANTGNPIYPLMWSVLGEGDHIGYAEHATDVAISAYGSEQRPIDYLALPWRVFMRQSHRMRHGGYGGGPLTPVLLLILPLLVVFPPRRRDERNLVFISFGFLALWTALVPHAIRLLFPAVPIWAALCGGVVERAGDRSRWLGRSLVAACIVLLIFPGLWMLLWLRARDVQYVLLPRKDHELIERHIPALPVLRAIDRTLPKETPVFSFNDDRYYCGARLFAGWSERTGRAALQTEDAREAVEALRSVGVAGVLFSDEDQETGRSVLFRPDVLGEYFQHVASANGWHFYTLAARDSKNGARG